MSSVSEFAQGAGRNPSRRPEEAARAALETGLGLAAVRSPGRRLRLETSIPPTGRRAKMLGTGRLLGAEEIRRGGQGGVPCAAEKSQPQVALKLSVSASGPPRRISAFPSRGRNAASLEHPCIVPIYEVGERDGSCYFSMKFIEGPARCRRGSTDADPSRSGTDRQAGPDRHYAHERGILHRDIKPGTSCSTQRANRV